MQRNIILQGDALVCLRSIPDGSIDCCITSPPYFGLRDYGMDGQIGLEETPEQYVTDMVAICREIRRALKKDGTLWLNLGDSYAGNGRGGATMANIEETNWKQKTNKGTVKMPKAIIPTGLKAKDLIGIPWKVAFALQADGWYLRQDIIWSKPNPMPESVTDRCTKSHEYVFLLSKSPKYYFDNEAIKERTLTQDSLVRDRDTTKLNNTPGRTRMQGLKTNNYEYKNKRSVWQVGTKPYKGAHFATYPLDLITPMIKAGCPRDGIVLDPFFGSGTTGVAAKLLNRDYIGIELNPEYIQLAEHRLKNTYAQSELFEP